MLSHDEPRRVNLRRDVPGGLRLFLSVGGSCSGPRLRCGICLGGFLFVQSPAPRDESTLSYLSQRRARRKAPFGRPESVYKRKRNAEVPTRQSWLSPTTRASCVGRGTTSLLTSVVLQGSREVLLHFIGRHFGRAMCPSDLLARTNTPPRRVHPVRLCPAIRALTLGKGRRRVSAQPPPIPAPKVGTG